MAAKITLFSPPKSLILQASFSNILFLWGSSWLKNWAQFFPLSEYSEQLWEVSKSITLHFKRCLKSENLRLNKANNLLIIKLLLQHINQITTVTIFITHKNSTTLQLQLDLLALDHTSRSPLPQPLKKCNYYTIQCNSQKKIASTQIVIK